MMSMLRGRSIPRGRRTRAATAKAKSIIQNAKSKPVLLILLVTKMPIRFIVLGYGSRKHSHSPEINMRTLFPPIHKLMVVAALMLPCLVSISAQERPVAGAEAKAQPFRHELDQPTPVDVAPEPTDP